MLGQRRISPQEVRELRIAAIRLFGLEQAASREFWRTLTLEQVKRAFRQKARLFHPDLQSSVSPETVKLKAERFVAVKEAYEILRRFLGAGHLYRLLRLCYW
ncbi:MAG: DnaJ domain-containing protein [Deltaproteobacteria bacterium]|nr:DnaJ domain-containing protein [Deltaproteobacteria bacterium]